MEWFVEHLGKAIFAECALTLKAMPAAAASATDVAPHLAFLSKLVARDSNLGRAHVFTLNYDTLLEQALERLGIQYFDGFSGRAEAKFDPSVYGLDIYYPGELAEGRVRRFDKFAHLYKLHGSLHWFISDGELRSRHPNLAPFGGYRELPPAEKGKKLPELAEGVPAVGILPTANKFHQTLTMPFAHLFRSLQIRLSAPQTFLLVMGYERFGLLRNDPASMEAEVRRIVAEEDSLSYMRADIGCHRSGCRFWRADGSRSS